MNRKIRQLLKRKGRLAMGMAVAVAVVLSLAFLRFMELRQDANRFAEADRIKQAVFDDLLKELDATPIQIAEKDVCYKSEQGPYDDGRLWCQVASSAYFAEPISRESVVERFRVGVTNRGYNLLTNEAGDLAFRTAGMSCGLDIYDKVMAVDPGYYLPENVASRQTIVVRCADRSKAKHHPYANID